jgi:hypothetical protein
MAQTAAAKQPNTNSGHHPPHSLSWLFPTLPIPKVHATKVKQLIEMSSDQPFTLQVLSCAEIIDQLGPQTLVILDELGAKTTPETSLPWMWSLSEKLLSLP